MSQQDTKKTQEGKSSTDATALQEKNKFTKQKAETKSSVNDQKKKKGFQGSTKGLEDHNIFYYGKGMDAKCLTTREKIIKYVGKKYSTNEEMSIKNGTFTVKSQCACEQVYICVDDIHALIRW